jgi:hypothetical protein
MSVALTTHKKLEILIADPGRKVACMGSRPAAHRPLFGFAARVFLLGSFMAVMGVGMRTAAEQSGMFDEAAARTHPSAITMPKPQQASWLEMPASPFLDVAKRADGTYSLDRLIGAYQKAGLNAQQAQAIVHILPELSPVLMGTDDPALGERLKASAKKTADQLAAAYPRAEKSLSSMIKSGHVPESHRVFPENASNWIPVRAEYLVPGAGPADLHAFDSATRSVTEARHNLELAVLTTGLRALRVNPTNLSNSASINDLSKGLLLANQDLAKATGWHGQVLGLGGRVILTSGSPPPETDAAAFATTDLTGDVNIVSDWESLGHEWLHALDYVAAQHTLTVSMAAPLTRQLQILRMTQDKSVFSAWKKADHELIESTPKWQSARQAIVVELNGQTKKEAVRSASSLTLDEAAYWVSSTEGMAFAFEAFIGHSKPAVLSIEYAGREPYRMPGEQEAMAQKNMWHSLFASMDHLKLTQPPGPGPALSATNKAPYAVLLSDRRARADATRASQPDPSLPSP